jgi:precorrin-6A/cobalt-precorrin-6A reductase
VDPPVGAMPAQMELLLDRGPFTLEAELSLLQQYSVDVLVTKNSGGAAPKLEAARTLGTPVIMVDRPAVSDSTAVVSTVDDALSWLLVVGTTSA